MDADAASGRAMRSVPLRAAAGTSAVISLSVHRVTVRLVTTGGTSADTRLTAPVATPNAVPWIVISDPAIPIGGASAVISGTIVDVATYRAIAIGPSLPRASTARTPT
ncbi:hypothetical protein L6R52_13820 [Myxococcota bacterium]|nr:hypothetical protein [Myxococcota bacterium]